MADLSRLIAIGAAKNFKKSMAALSANIANVDSPAYQEAQVTFTRKTSTRPIDGSPIDFASHVLVTRNTAQGSFKYTGHDLSAMIEGPGYFKVTTSDGKELYTRAGIFSLDSEGNVVTMSGDKVSGAGGAEIKVPGAAQMVEIRKDGHVLADGESVGKLEVVKFQDDQVLERMDNGYFETKATSEPVEEVKLIPKGFEGSNGNTILSMTRLSEESRMFQILMGQIKKNEEVHDAVMGTVKTAAA